MCYPFCALLQVNERHEYPDDVLVASHLGKTGVRIRLQDGHHDFERLLRETVISRTLLEKYGFLLLENFDGLAEPLAGEKLLKDDSTIQYIHRDLPSANAAGINVIALRCPQQEKLRGAHTVLGESETILRKLSEFVLHDESVPTAMRQFREKIAALGTDSINPALAYDDHQTWSEAVFVHLAQTVRGRGYPRIRELYQALAPSLYFHVWRPKQLLVWNDYEMVHGRVPFAVRDPEHEGGYLLRMRMFWADGEEGPVLVS